MLSCAYIACGFSIQVGELKLKIMIMIIITRRKLPAGNNSSPAASNEHLDATAVPKTFVYPPAILTKAVKENKLFSPFMLTCIPMFANDQFNL